MKRRPNVTAAAAAALFFCTAAAFAADLSPEVRQAGDAAKFAADIDKYIRGQIDRVAAGDAKTPAARDEICRQVESTQTISVTGSFQAEYVSALERNIVPLLKSKKLPDRLNAAIIISRVAGATKLSTLQDEIVGLMNDPSPAVVLWGVKAARSTIPSVLSAAFMLQNQKLTPAVVSAVKAHGDVGAIVQEAYAALDITQSPQLPPPAAIVAASDAMLDVLEARVATYVKQMPVAPQTERDPLNFFGRGPVYKALQDKQKLRVVQDFSNLMAVAADRSRDEGGATRQVLMDVASNAAGALSVQMQLAGSTAASAPLKQLTQIDRLKPNEIAPAVTAAIQSVRTVSQFATLKDPPVAEKAPTASATGG
jgi:hypothetical protein